MVHKRLLEWSRPVSRIHLEKYGISIDPRDSGGFLATRGKVHHGITSPSRPWDRSRQMRWDTQWAASCCNAMKTMLGALCLQAYLYPTSVEILARYTTVLEWWLSSALRYRNVLRDILIKGCIYVRKYASVHSVQIHHTVPMLDQRFAGMYTHQALTTMVSREESWSTWVGREQYWIKQKIGKNDKQRLQYRE